MLLIITDMPIDQRAQKLAKIAVEYSIDVKPKEKVIISGGSEAIPLLKELYKEIIKKEAYPIVKVGLPDIADFFYKNAKEHQLEFFPKYWFQTVKEADAFIGIYTESNTRELTNIPGEKISRRRKVTEPISTYIVDGKPDIRRLTMAYPCEAHAQEASMSLNEWEDYVYDSCLIEWREFSKTLDERNKKLENGKEVELKGEGVDLKFSIKGQNSIADKGEENMPGGEIFMAPNKKTLEGEIKFDYPRIYSGQKISGIWLKFKEGEIVDFDAKEGKALLKEIINTDKNSKFIGEFGIGCNPNIDKYTNNLLFDEKIDGTIHLAIGKAYKDNGGGNDSAVHVDIVKDMSNC
ncbi:MAG: aminopeptidase, partial [Nanoarchaeota archaeon]